MSFYGKYKNVRNTSWQVLIDYQVDTLPVKIFELASRIGVTVRSYDRAKALLRLLGYKDKRDLPEDGMTVEVAGKWHILYNPLKSDAVIRFTIAHELGHILLGHNLQVHKTVFFRTRQPESSPALETEANIFASRLLAPATVIAALKLTTPEEIMQVCDISYTAASIRAKRMETLYRRNMFDSHPLERKLTKQFAPFVEAQQKGRQPDEQTTEINI